MMGKTCKDCRNCFNLKKWDYSQDGCKHTDMDGLCCMALGFEGLAIWMYGTDMEGTCEMFSLKEK